MNQMDRVRIERGAHLLCLLGLAATAELSGQWVRIGGS